MLQSNTNLDIAGRVGVGSQGRHGNLTGRVSEGNRSIEAVHHLSRFRWRRKVKGEAERLAGSVCGLRVDTSGDEDKAGTVQLGK